MNNSFLRFGILMFFQFFTWGAWFSTLGLCLGSNQFGEYTGSAYGAAPLGAMIAPLFLGLVADRFFPFSGYNGRSFYCWRNLTSPRTHGFTCRRW